MYQGPQTRSRTRTTQTAEGSSRSRSESASAHSSPELLEAPRDPEVWPTTDIPIPEQLGEEWHQLGDVQDAENESPDLQSASTVNESDPAESNRSAFGSPPPDPVTRPYSASSWEDSMTEGGTRFVFTGQPGTMTFRSF